jgi:hypothetical protein
MVLQIASFWILTLAQKRAILLLISSSFSFLSTIRKLTLSLSFLLILRQSFFFFLSFLLFPSLLLENTQQYNMSVRMYSIPDGEGFANIKTIVFVFAKHTSLFF